MDFSIVICNYNYGRFVGDAIRSCLEQDCIQTSFEIVVVDDGSTDESRTIVDAFADRENVRAVYQPNRGQGAALAAGVLQARGRFICLLDADDVFAPSKLRRVAEHLQKLAPLPRDLFLCHDVRLFDQAAGRPTEQTWFEVINLGHAPAQLALEQVEHQFPFAIPCGQILSRDLAVRIFDGLPSGDWRYAVDSAVAQCALLTTGVVHYLHECLAFYRIHGANDLAGLVNGRYRPRGDWQSRIPGLLMQLERYAATLALDTHERATRLAYLKSLERRLRATSPTRRLRQPRINFALDAGADASRLEPTLASIAAQTQEGARVTLLLAENARIDAAIEPLLRRLDADVLSLARDADVRSAYRSCYADARGEYFAMLRPGATLAPTFVAKHLAAHQQWGLADLSLSDAPSAIAAAWRRDTHPGSNLSRPPTPLMPPFAAAFDEMAFPALAACVLRRGRLLDAFFEEPDDGALGLLPFWARSLLLYCHGLSGALVIEERLLTWPHGPDVEPAPRWPIAPGEHAEVARTLWRLYCRRHDLFERNRAPAWHLQFAQWLTAGRPRQAIEVLRRDALAHGARAALELLDELEVAG